MLFGHAVSGFNFVADNWGSPSLASMGTSVTPGASNAEGSWTQLIAGATITRDVLLTKLAVYAGGTSAQQKDHLLDIGIDPAGGSSYTPIISDIVCGASAANMSQGILKFLLPYVIPAGSSLAGRIQGNNATAGTVKVMAKVFGDPTNPESAKRGQYSETIGTITNSQGVAFTPGNGAWGSYTLLGTTSRDLWWWQMGVQLSSSNVAALQNVLVQLAYGDATNKQPILTGMYTGTTTEVIHDGIKANLCSEDCYLPVPGGTNIYIRAWSDVAPDTGWNAVAVGIGG